MIPFLLGLDPVPVGESVQLGVNILYRVIIAGSAQSWVWKTMRTAHSLIFLYYNPVYSLIFS